jgi:hypothetical protein
MKAFLGGKRFQNNGEVIAGVQRWIHEPPKTFSETGLKNFPESWYKCIAVNRDYTAKQCVKLSHCVANKFFRTEFSFKIERPLYFTFISEVTTFGHNGFTTSKRRNGIFFIIIRVLNAVGISKN